MSSFVDGYQYDIFVSYAHVDNTPLPGAEQGWVSTLINGLRNHLGQKLGRSDAYQLWLDTTEPTNAQLLSKRQQNISESALLLIILSPAYLASAYCMSDLSQFIITTGVDAGRIFIVEHDYIDPDERPPSLEHIMGYPFWIRDTMTQQIRKLGVPKPNPEREFEYYQRLDDVAREMVNKLKSMRQTVHPAVENSTPMTTVFLASATEDLIEQRSKIKRYLIQQNIRVLPENSTGFNPNLTQDLEQSQLFIQLLTDKTDGGYALFQYQQAKQANLKILQWRPQFIDVNSITDQNQRDLLMTDTVVVMGLVEFQHYVSQQISKWQQMEAERQHQAQFLQQIQQQTEQDIVVFIDANPDDMSLGQQISEVLQNYGIAYTLPLPVTPQTKAAEIRKDLKNNLLYSDALLILYGEATPEWVRGQLWEVRRLQGNRKQSLKVLAVFNQLSQQKPPLNMNLPNMRLLECSSTQLTDQCLQDFIQALQQ
ncbi:toll/interleukin-1 receptor domain-containing protein [Candidatus Albibeggiatoa sp. nov. NOAA]|uniref:toll/interleukin-1 receptor domain-containing protein n=1 Tax=Candidatus Albibeggiatoa sp. nov. NOAA TaxID=3162724 RepID=UPI0033015C93|nr:toll/interleukin-1 receptor domain-containing protein [Thiotrichaceae bacterium]